MNNSEFIKGSVGEINNLLSSLMTRKQSILDDAYSKGDEDKCNPLDTSYARYLEMMGRMRKPVSCPRIVYQGEPGAYSEAAARSFFGRDVNAKGLLRFEDTFLALASGEADYAVLPIENSSTGAIRQVYDLLESYSYFFVGETTVRIDHALMALPGVSMDQIREVYSHEQGLFQCEKFLAQHPEWKTFTHPDTAGSARMVAELKDPCKAAICSPLAADIYGLDILLEKVNTNSSNTTRFVVVSPFPELRQNRDKICISLTTGHRSGALRNILTVFSVNGINLQRLESRPIPEHNWEYMFFIEFTGDLESRAMDAVIHELCLMSDDLRVLGNFKNNL
ncbi:MAG: prephenate dehydratase [Parasporobacterium sp.]|nr:prephenate dehydratase [Parasporobacterium sp.]